MDAVIAAIIGAIAALLAAWLAGRKQTTTKTRHVTEAYRRMFESLYQVRLYYATLRYLLVDVEPGPTFAEDVIRAGCSFRDACDALQLQVGSRQQAFTDKAYGRLVQLVSAASDLIDGLNRCTSGKIPAPQAQKELTDLLGRFGKTLIRADQIKKQWRRL